MIDLHLHFDGSLLPRTVLELAQEQGILLPATEPDELKLFLAAPEECGSLNEYLEKFDLPLQVLQTKEAVRKAMYILVSSLKEQGMLYAGNPICAPASHEEGYEPGAGGEGGFVRHAGGAYRFVFQL